MKRWFADKLGDAIWNYDIFWIDIDGFDGRNFRWKWAKRLLDWSLKNDG